MAARTSSILLPFFHRVGVPLRRKWCLRRSPWFSSQCCGRSLSGGITPPLSPQLAGKSYAELYELSVKEPETFWGSVAKDRLTWSRAFQQVSDCDLRAGRISWFGGGQLNVSGEEAAFLCFEEASSHLHFRT
ncbi:probable acetyl-coenzyme A synthetase [Colossoma macropomum]|uniref:probable acetyl-coenzyme A synthetase n=1 Tax=Colossoma macropomum TaxID=42526 RepID=UPI00186480B3|nr:probable acetyl-coenzyme A synthetase [Colossoma macropomum]